jgi:hypothetical protein
MSNERVVEAIVPLCHCALWEIGIQSVQSYRILDKTFPFTIPPKIYKFNKFLYLISKNKINGKR